MRKIYIAGVLLFISTVAHSYDLRTHAQITKRAYDRSLMANPELYKQLGFKSLKLVGANEYDLRGTYFDFEPYKAPTEQGNRFRFRFDYGLEIPASGAEFSTRTWLMSGAVREDDGSIFVNKYGPSARYGSDPQDDPFGGINRFCNHFYDPLYDRGFTSTLLGDPIAYAGCGAVAEKLVNWAVGTNDAFATSVQPATTYRNHFTIFAAREAMWRALTLTMKQQSGGYVPLPNLPALPEDKEKERLKYWTTVFRMLGDTAHLIQDSAQPQHTRNEGHGLGHAAEYELFIDARANRDVDFTFKDPKIGIGKIERKLNALTFDPDYPIPTLPSFTDYWTTERGSAPRTSSTTVGRGIADYSSRGFLTPGSGIGNSNYPSPPPILANNYTIVDETPATTEDCGYFAPVAGDPTSVSWRYAKYGVRDSVTGALTSIRMQSLGFFDKYLQAKGSLTRHYGFNECTWNDRAALLLPRAVAYSAGVINHFFRGKMEIKLPPEGVYAIIDHADPLNNCKDDCGFKKIKAKIKNTTPAIIASGTSTAYPQNMVNGEMVAIAKFHRNNCYRPDLRGEYVRAFGVNTGYNKVEITYSNSWRECRSTIEESMVSKPTSGVNLAADAENSYTFDFDKPIPINATDLFLQIVFRGKLGNEEDALAVQMVDISEPNYLPFASADGVGVEFGGTTSALCFPFDRIAVISGGASPWCQVAYIMGVDNYKSNTIEQCPRVSYSLKPAQLQVNEATGEYEGGTFGHTFFTNLAQTATYALDSTFASWTQTAWCVFTNGSHSSIQLTAGLSFGINSSTGGGGVNTKVPPVKVQSINF